MESLTESERLAFGLDRLPRSEREGYLDFGDLSVPLLFYYDCPDSEHSPQISSKTPAGFVAAGDGMSIMAWVHWSVPEVFRDVVLYHEAVEAELAHRWEMDQERCHEIARMREEVYAARHLEPAVFEEYLLWRQWIDGNIEACPLISAGEVAA